jgi:Histidine kinase
MSLRARYWLFQAIGWGTYSAVGIVFAAQQVGWSSALVSGYLLFFCYSIALTEGYRRVMIGGRWLERSSWHLWLPLAAGVLAIAAIQVFLVVSIGLALVPGPDAWSVGSVLGLAWSVTLATAMWTALYVRLTENRRRKAREVAIQLTLREAELRALRQQVNPHFLFNCLNSIRALVVEDPPRAQDMVTRLANMLRYTLGREPRDTAPLSAEMAIVDDYLALESVRLEERLRVEVDVAADAKPVDVPRMLLPTLVENAITHGIAARPAGGTIAIRVRREDAVLSIEVANSGALGDPRPESLGLANLRERLRLLYGDRAAFSLREEGQDRVVARVSLPVAP